MDAMARANGRRSRRGRNATRSVPQATAPVTPKAQSHAHSIRQPRPWFTAKAAKAPMVR